ncbi:MAG: sigma-70 family RNA polymerase sigma factor [Verrucomicrobiia bacterium]
MMTRLESSSDTRLVELSREGDRKAFAGIVEKYQSLICGLTYSACGNIQSSEDLAQVTFITAWCQLRDLREPAKLKAWLCRIARNATTDSFRKQQRTPTANAEAIDSVAEIPSDAPTPSEQVMSKEEQAILWRALGDLPPNYREPLVLFYRQNQSVAEVAESLDLPEDVVKQRLSRGRAMLSEQVSRLVETTLRTSGPTNAFTVGVLAALPVWTASSSAATVGATAAKGSIVAKSAASVGLAGAILGPLIGVLGGLFGSYMSIKNTKSPRERRFMINMSLITLAFVGMFYLATFALIFVAHFWWKTHPTLVAAAFIGMILGYGVALALLIVWGNCVQSRIRAEDAAKLPPGTLLPGLRMSSPWRVSFPPLEYRSRWTLLGLPLVHVRMNCKQEGKELPAKGWIAVGGIAYGVLFAFGAVAIAPISMGGAFAVGLLSLGGGCAVGLLSIGGGFGFGVWAMGGGLAMGLLAFGGCAVGWTAALGGAAFAREFARGGLALARHANDAAAGAFIQNNAFFQNALAAMRHARWLALLVPMPLGLLCWAWMKKTRAKQPPFGL